MNKNILEIDSRIRQLLCKPQQLAVNETPDGCTRWFAKYLQTPSPDFVSYEFYLVEVIRLLLEYEIQLNTPRSIDFFKKTACTSAKQLNQFYNMYVEKLQSLKLDEQLTLDVPDVEDTSNLYTCSCPSPSFYMEDPDFYVCCKHCGRRTELNNVSVNYGDVKRLNISQKNPHDKKNHFSECIDRYQGKQKVSLPDDLLERIEGYLDLYAITMTAANRADKFVKVKKDHIKLILKSLELYKQHKEDINVIYRLITDKPLPSIDHLKRRLLEDFDTFDCRYNQLFSKIEKSAYHYYLILYELLCSYKVPCNKADFNFLKTAERKSQHDQKYRQVFESLGWNYTPFF